jgi:hypothetical protein
MGTFCDGSDGAGRATGARVKPEVRGLLEPLGWSRVQEANPLFAAGLAAVFTLEGGGFAKTASDAVKVRTDLEATFRAVFDAWKLLGGLPREIARRVNTTTEALERLKQGDRDISAWPSPSDDQIETARRQLWTVLAGLESTLAQIEREAGKAKRGRQKNEAAYRVAHAVAAIYMIGLGVYPSIGNRSDGSGPSGLFCNTTKAVCHELGIEVGDVVPVCRQVLSEKSDDDLLCYELLSDPEKRHHVVARMARMDEKS